MILIVLGHHWWDTIGLVDSGLRKSFQDPLADIPTLCINSPRHLVPKLTQDSCPTCSVLHLLTRHSAASAGLNELTVLSPTCTWAYHALHKASAIKEDQSQHVPVVQGQTTNCVILLVTGSWSTVVQLGSPQITLTWGDARADSGMCQPVQEPVQSVTHISLCVHC